MDPLNHEKNHLRRRCLVYPVRRSSSWPDGGREGALVERILADCTLQNASPAQQNRDGVANINDTNETINSLLQINTGNSSTPAAIPSVTRYSSFFESSCALLPAIQTEGRLRTLELQRRSSSLTTVSQRSLWLADLLQEAIDISGTLGFISDNDDVFNGDTEGNFDDDVNHNTDNGDMQEPY